MTLYFVDASGNYLGGFDGATPPSGSVQVPTAPADGRQKWVNGVWADPAPVQADYEAAVQSMLDAKAQQFGYDDIKSAATYAGDPDATFNDQGTKLKTWRSQCWRTCYNELAAVQAGTATQPTIAQLLAMLPASPL